MDALQHHLAAGWALLRIEAPDSEIFLGPVESLAAAAIAGKTARESQPLRFRQISFTAPQSFFGPFTVLDVGARAVPPQNAPVLIPQRIVSEQEPAILSMFCPYLVPPSQLAYRRNAPADGLLLTSSDPPDEKLWQPRLLTASLAK